MNLQKFGVQELSVQEKKKTQGGWWGPFQFGLRFGMSTMNSFYSMFGPTLV